jgi:hypothetical protein
VIEGKTEESRGEVSTGITPLKRARLASTAG